MTTSTPGGQQGEEAKGGEREAREFVGKWNKEVAKRKESNTRTPTSTGLLQLGPRRNYLTWRPAKAPRLSPSALVQSAVRAAGTTNSQGFSSASHPKRRKKKKKETGQGLNGLIFTQLRLFC